MSEYHYAYEAVGLRDTGDVYTVEILGRQTEAVAVDLYRVPYVRLEGQWRDDQIKLVQQFLPTRAIN
jgi:hypothetical protein